MQEHIISNNESEFIIDGQNGKRAVRISKIKSLNDLSFLVDGQDLSLQVNVDGTISRRKISSYPFDDEEGRSVVIDEVFSKFNTLIVHVFTDNPLLYGEISFNAVIEYDTILAESVEDL